MYPPKFQLHTPRNLDEALELLAKYGEEAKILAGGHSLIPMMKLRIAAPAHIIYIGKLTELNYIKEETGTIHIGALTTHNQIEESQLLKTRNPLMSETASKIGDLQVRNMGTIGGSLSHADPAADYPAAVLALEAELVARSVDGERVIKAENFFKDAFTTDLKPNELLTEIRVPALQGAYGTAYEKLVFRATDFAIVGVAALVKLNQNGEAEKVRVALTGVGNTAVRAYSVEKQLEGTKITEETIAEASKKASENLNPPSDIRASSEYRKAMAEVLTKRALTRALKKARQKQ